VLISSTAFDHVRGKIDVEFVDIGEKVLKNIARPVRAYAVKLGSVSAAPTRSVAAPTLPGSPRLSIVVLPFANMGGGAEQEYFVDGVTESLTTDLSRIRGAFRDRAQHRLHLQGQRRRSDAGRPRVERPLCAGGSVQRGGKSNARHVQLIDAEAGNHLWAERFDKPLADLFDMQDEIVARLTGALNTQLAAREARRGAQARTPT